VNTLTHLVVVWMAVYVATLLAMRTRITPVLYYLAIGCVLVNIGVLPEDSGVFIRGLAELGILIIMFALGFDENISDFLDSVRHSWGITLFGALAPFVTAFLVADYFWGETNISLIFGLTMAATAVSLTMVSLRSVGLERSVVATRILTAAVLDGIASLFLVAIVIPIAIGDESIEPAKLLLIGLKAVVFFVFMAAIAKWVLPAADHYWLRKIPLIGRFGIRRLLVLEEGQHATLTVLLFALGVGLLAHYFGFHAAVGAYIAGLILKEDYFQPQGSRYSYAETRHVVDIVAFSVVGPIFFVDLGTRLVLDIPLIVSIIPQVVALTVSIIMVQVTAASLAARYTGSMNWHESLMIGFGMLGRAEIAFIVMDIAYVQHSVLTKGAFYTLMVTAFWLNVFVPVSISWWKPRLVKSGVR